jgi:hypothetical protein
MHNFELVKTVPQIEGRKLVFAHFLSTHEPFIIDGEGKYNYEKELKNGYVSSINGTNAEMLKIIDLLIKNSSNPPVVIIQGDHAYSENKKNRILNAYYLPNIKPDLVNPEITPVNTFRLILQEYFGLPFDQLVNKGYSSPNKFKPTDFELVPNSCYSD